MPLKSPLNPELTIKHQKSGDLKKLLSMPQLQTTTLPATSATTTNHYIINNLNFIGTPKSAKPEQAIEALCNLKCASAGEQRADGFDLIM